MSSSQPYRSGFGVAAVVFVVGAGLGFGWKLGWLPIELLPAQTGALDELAATDEEVPPPRLIPERPIADAPRAGSALDSGIFEQQSEPSQEPADLSPANGLSPRPVQQSAAQTTADPAPSPPVVPSRRVVQAAAFEESASASAEAVPQSIPFDLSAALSEFDQKIQNGEVLAAHRLLSQVYWKQRIHRAELQDHLDRSAAAIFFQPQPHFVEPYVIEPGDRLETIAAAYKVPWEYLSQLNRIDPKRIQAGKRLKVVRGPFAAVVELTDFSLTVHLQGYYVRRFPVGIGRDGASPIGKFSVLNKVVNPQYTDPDGRVIDGDDPANPLGERWIDLGNSYGIHGTIEPDSIGKAASRGCIRLGSEDVVTVYNFLSVGSDVVIRR
ncbi:MAG: L,D-transpeptidase family protein [Planctomycetaceae bacterium]|nr:L,D-transpeptidase family protein [Planctomycetaceae bacterium]